MKFIAAAIVIAGGAIAFAVGSTGGGVHDGESVGSLVLVAGGGVYAIEYYRSLKIRGD